MKTFTPRERLLAVGKKLSADRTPCICPGGMMNMMFREIMEKSGCPWPEAHTDPQKMAALACALNESGGFENYGLPFCMTVEAEAMGARVNMGNMSNEPHVLESPLTSSAQVNLLKPLNIDVGRARVVIEAIKILRARGSDVPIIGNLTGPVSTAGTLVDMSILLKEFRKKPDKAERMMEYMVMNLVKFGQAQIQAGADAICISEPSGTGEILGPQLFRNYSLRYLNQLMDALDDAAVKIVHICGILKSVYHILPELKCDVFSVDSMVGLEEIKKYLPDKAIMGNINTHALATMPPEKIAKLTKYAMSRGADIVAPACGLSTTTPLLNVQTMVRTAITEWESTTRLRSGEKDAPDIC